MSRIVKTAKKCERKRQIEDMESLFKFFLETPRKGLRKEHAEENSKLTLVGEIVRLCEYSHTDKFVREKLEKDYYVDVK